MQHPVILFQQGWTDNSDKLCPNQSSKKIEREKTAYNEKEEGTADTNHMMAQHLLKLSETKIHVTPFLAFFQYLKEAYIK